jgi:hypothetical protein
MVIVFGILIYPSVKQTFPIKIIRCVISGKPFAQFEVDDFADDVRSKRRLKPLQEWSVQTLARYRAGQLTTKMYYGSARLAPQEVPEWLSQAWGDKPPEVSVSLNFSNNEPECIDVRWYLDGLLVGPTNYVTTAHTWYIVQVKPGIYAYAIER